MSYAMDAIMDRMHCPIHKCLNKNGKNTNHDFSWKFAPWFHAWFGPNFAWIRILTFVVNPISCWQFGELFIQKINIAIMIVMYFTLSPG